MGHLFGTDGIRGLANRDLTAPMALDVAVAAARVLAGHPSDRSERPRAVVGRDTRVSGEFLEAAVVAGLAAAGVDVIRLGVLPTPGIAYLTAELAADFGIVLSASHNPMPDNGLKILAAGGVKLADETEERIEHAVGEDHDLPTGDEVGRVIDGSADAVQKYIDHLVASVPQRLDGLTVVIDGANGAASTVSPDAFSALGAQVVAINCAPTGFNINEACGSTHMDELASTVVARGADLGIAHDGDADRCLAVDRHGVVIDGDQIMAILAISLHEAGKLRHNTLVTTVMSNQGLRLALRDRGIDCLQTSVGDRYVLEAMRAGGYSLGGEQSGHVIVSDYATTGDGVLTGLLLAAEVARRGVGLDELAAVMVRLPQVLVNVPGVDRTRVDSSRLLTDAVRDAQTVLGEKGRVLLRPSGTEPLVRVMVEAEHEETAREIAEQLAAVVSQELALR